MFILVDKYFFFPFPFEIFEYFQESMTEAVKIVYDDTPNNNNNFRLLQSIYVDFAVCSGQVISNTMNEACRCIMSSHCYICLYFFFWVLKIISIGDCIFIVLPRDQNYMIFLI